MNYDKQMEYRRKYIKQRVIDFNMNEMTIYDFSKTINFSRFIKDMLRENMNDPELMSKYVR